MNKLLIDYGIKDITCETIHSLQGAEKDTIILSTSISPKTSKKTYKWLKNNSEFINVATTRAKNKLIISSDFEALSILSDKKDDLYSLVKYVKDNGTSEVDQSETTKIEIGKSNDSRAEDEFFKTISQFCTTNKTFEAKRNVSYSKIFPDDKALCESNGEFDVVLYTYTPFGKKIEIIIEINGGEHFGDAKREYNDELKRELCRKNRWKFISIPNSLVKSYEEIREIILATRGEQYKQLSLF